MRGVYRTINKSTRIPVSVSEERRDTVAISRYAPSGVSGHHAYRSLTLTVLSSHECCCCNRIRPVRCRLRRRRRPGRCPRDHSGPVSPHPTASPRSCFLGRRHIRTERDVRYCSFCAVRRRHDDSGRRTYRNDTDGNFSRCQGLSEHLELPPSRTADAAHAVHGLRVQYDTRACNVRAVLKCPKKYYVHVIAYRSRTSDDRRFSCCARYDVERNPAGQHRFPQWRARGVGVGSKPFHGIRRTVLRHTVRTRSALSQQVWRVGDATVERTTVRGDGLKLKESHAE